MKKRVLSVFLILCMLLAAMPLSAFAADDVTAQWKNFRNSDGNMAITDAKTPVSADTTELKWTLKADAVGGWPTVSPQLIVDGYMITSLNQELCKVDLETGEKVDSVTMSGMPDYGNTPMTYGEGLIYVPLGNGTVEAYDAKTLTKEWTYSDTLGGQSQSPVTYSDGYVYTGFWVGKTSDANYVCLDANTGELQWSYTVKGGFYWAGGVEVGDFIVVGTDDGTTDATGTARLLAFKKNYQSGETVAPVDALDLTGYDDVHSSIAYGNGSLYFTTTAGYLCLAVIDPDTGKFSGFKGVDHGAASTSTPIVYGNEVYFGVNDGTAGSYFVAANAATLEEEYKVEMKAYPQCSFLLSTAYDDGLYFYGTYNNLPGGITLIKADPENNTAEAIEIYTPEEANQQYCISSVICDSEGTLYYKNDSGNIFAVGSTEESGGNQNNEGMEDEEGNLNTDTIEVYVSIAKDGEFVNGADADETVMANAKVMAKDLNDDGKINVDEVFMATHETYHRDELGGYASATSQWGLGITMLWGDTSGAFGYYNNDASCWSLEDEVKDGDYVKAYIYKDQTGWSDKYTTFEEEEYTAEAGEAVTVTLLGAGYDENWNTVFSPYEGATITVNGEATDYVTDDKGQVTLTFDKAGTYQVVARDADVPLVPSVCTVTVTEVEPAADITAYVTIAKDAEIAEGVDGTPVADVAVAVKDLNKNGKINVDEVLASVHESYYEGGAADGYQSGTTEWGLSIFMLWGDTSGAFGYWKNDASCWSLEDEVKDGDYVKAYIYKDQTGWSDKYTTFEEEEYTAEAGEAVTVTLLGAGYDENWNTVFTPYESAKITINGEATSYVTDDKGQVTLTFDEAGTYQVVASDADAPLVPSVCTVTVTEGSTVTPSGPDAPGADKNDTDLPATETPKTGDSGDLVAWLTILFVMAVAAVTIYKRSEE